MAINAVSLKIPPFWPADPLLWFAQVDYVIAALSPEYATELRDLVLSPPEDELFKALKDALVQRTAGSEQQRLQQLFKTEELGDCKPTQLLRRMQQLLGDKATGLNPSFMRELFLQCLPTNVRLVLALTAESITLQELANLADKVMEVATPTMASVSPPDSLVAEISELKAEIAQVKRLLKSYRSTPCRRAGSPASTHLSLPTSISDLCLYHQKFGETAKKCKPPCSQEKYPSQLLVAMGVTGLNHHSRLFYIVDACYKLPFLIDTGADVSIIPSTSADKNNCCHLTLQAVNNSPISIFSTRSLTLNLGLRHTFHWVFVITQVKTPILDADFLRYYGLLVERLIDTVTYLRVQGIVSNKAPLFCPRQLFHHMTKFSLIYQLWFSHLLTRNPKT